MKNGLKSVMGMLLMAALVGCAQQAVKPDETSKLKEQLKQQDDQIDILNEKLSMMTAIENQTMEEKNKEIGKLNENYSNLLKSLAEEKAAGNVKISQQQNVISIAFMDKIFFDSGSVEIKKEGKSSLDKLAKVLKTNKDRLIRVEGYTDNVPIADSFKWKYPSNWELSTARADSIVRYLQSQGVNPDLMKSTGYGMFNPVASNATEQGRAQNRRIVVELVPLDIRARYK